ncbi:MAG: hypothetical protein EAX90_05910 [Candidatus Heimdallarchaeota archaeon]|nr:hypothetical protein [Candidatus Heimdallarchaeota archaeon]
MNARFELPLDSEIDSQLEEIAQKYATEVKLLDDGKSKMINPPIKLRILQRFDENNITIKVRGATEEDISFLGNFWGSPKSITEESRSALEFANEVLKIPDVTAKSKEEIIELMDIDEADFDNYMKQMERGASRGRGPEAILKAYEILNK